MFYFVLVSIYLFFIFSEKFFCDFYIYNLVVIFKIVIFFKFRNLMLSFRVV